MQKNRRSCLWSVGFFAKNGPRNLNVRNWWGKLVECNLRFC